MSKRRISQGPKLSFPTKSMQPLPDKEALDSFFSRILDRYVLVGEREGQLMVFTTKELTRVHFAGMLEQAKFSVLNASEGK
jgi:hypothetical protein